MVRLCDEQASTVIAHGVWRAGALSRYKDVSVYRYRSRGLWGSGVLQSTFVNQMNIKT